MDVVGSVALRVPISGEDVECRAAIAGAPPMGRARASEGTRVPEGPIVLEGAVPVLADRSLLTTF